MSQKAIREFDAKRMLAQWLSANAPTDAQLHNMEKRFVQVSPDTVLDELPIKHPWLLQTKLVAKPDQLIKRRGKAGLLCLNADWEQIKQWIQDRIGKEIQVDRVRGVLTHFLIEPFCPHSEEFYLCIHSVREGDEILFYHKGGVDIGDVDSKANRFLVEIGDEIGDEKSILARLPLLVAHVHPESKQLLLARYFRLLFRFYSTLNFSYLEINPLTINSDGSITPLDMAAKVDQAAEFECGQQWGPLPFPAPFGRKPYPEESYIADLDSKTGASLKLTVLNPNGRIWTMVAGGGASVLYADTICDLGAGAELANYGEYSGDPSEALTYEYAKTILKLMCSGEKRPDGKILLIGGGIANFTNVAETFKGIVRALTEMQHPLNDYKVQIYVRRGGPNYMEGLQMMRQLGVQINVPIQVYGPETHITSIVSISLGLDNSLSPQDDANTNGNGTDQMSRSMSTTNLDTVFPSSGGLSRSSSFTNLQLQANQQAQASPLDSITKEDTRPFPAVVAHTDTQSREPWNLFTEETRSIVYGLQERAVQGMIDFDHVCGRKTPSVAAMIYPFANNHYLKFWWGTQEILIPIFQRLEDAVKKFPEVDTFINFASFRSVYSSTLEMLQFPQIRTIAIIAEGVPENRTKTIIKMAKAKGVTVIGPATVGGIKPGCFKIGNTGGVLDNIISSKLYRPGSVAFVSKSGGLSNELNNIISRNSNGVYEGIAIGGDRFPGTTFIDHFLRFEADPNIKMLVLLGEVGGQDEYEICRALETRQIKKPVIAWCTGGCAALFSYDVQFGHAGACAHSSLETSAAKNEALRRAGAFVPRSFEDFGKLIREVYTRLVQDGVIVPGPEPEPPKIPMDYMWAQKLGLIRKPASFVSSISDERGEELIYSGIPISRVFQEDIGIGGVVGLLWFRRRLPDWASKFIEMILMITADHGPAVSGAHNTIVTARAGKDLVSSLCSGLLTIGPRFGGAIDAAAEQFSTAYDTGLKPKEFVENMRKKNVLLMGIGHKIKSLDKPDMRVAILKDYISEHFPSHPILDYALEVEKITTQKKANLILNVDGVIGCAFVDLLRDCGAFTREEADEYVHSGILNGLFVLGRTIGLIGHFVDQRRLKQGLYRHPSDDIAIVNEY